RWVACSSSGHTTEMSATPRPRSVSSRSSRKARCSSAARSAPSNGASRVLHRPASGAFAITAIAGRTLQAPVEPAAPAALGRIVVRGVPPAELAVPLAVPDRLKGPLPHVAEDDVLVRHAGERRDAAGQAVAVGGDVAEPPRAAAAAPGRPLDPS